MHDSIPAYRHTQHAPLCYYLFAAAVVIAVGGALNWKRPPFSILLLTSAAAVAPLSFAFGRLTVQDEGDALAIRYGPLPLFRKKIPYAAIRSVEAGRSATIDGWGIHCIPGRGWTYNLWGYDCAILNVNGATCRIGSDDVQNLVAFLRGRIPPAGRPAAGAGDRS